MGWVLCDKRVKDRNNYDNNGDDDKDDYDDDDDKDDDDVDDDDDDESFPFQSKFHRSAVYNIEWRIRKRDAFLNVLQYPQR